MQMDITAIQVLKTPPDLQVDQVVHADDRALAVHRRRLEQPLSMLVPASSSASVAFWKGSHHLAHLWNPSFRSRQMQDQAQTILSQLPPDQVSFTTTKGLVCVCVCE